MLQAYERAAFRTDQPYLCLLETIEPYISRMACRCYQVTGRLMKNFAVEVSNAHVANLQQK